MSKLVVYIIMASILVTNVAVFSVVFVNQSRAVQSTAGQGFDEQDGVGGIGTSGSLQQLYADFGLPLDKPMDVTRANDYIYVSDTNNQRIQVFSLDGTPLFDFGEQGTQPGQFRFPYGIAGDNQNRVYVADMYNGKISIHNASGEFLDYFALELSEQQIIQSPGGLRIINDHVYVTDIRANKVFVLNLSGNLLLEIGEAGSGEGQFLAPNAITADDEGNIYVVDTGNQRVQVFDPEGNFVLMFNGSPNGEGDSLFVNPRGIGINSDGEVSVVSNLTHIVHVFDKEGNPLSQFGGMGDRDGRFYLPNGLFIDNNDTTYVTDTLNQRVSVIN